MTRDVFRRGISAVFVAACTAAVILALIPLALILFYVVKQGVQALNLDLFTEMPKPAGVSTPTGSGAAGMWVLGKPAEPDGRQACTEDDQQQARADEGEGDLLGLLGEADA